MKRAAIYARFSTDMQNERSIEDQIALCRDYAVRQGFTVVETCEDRALSGASLHNRPGIQELMTAAKRRQFEIVVAESMSRIGRDQEDRAAIRKRLKFAGVTIMTPADGVVTDLTDGIRAVIDSQYLDDLKHAVRRGMSGKVRAGLSGGGLTYGYRVVKKFDEKGEPVKGLREVDEDQAAIVRRIFVEYIAGRSPRTIAYDLNRDGVPPPRGSRWNASTINGNQRRGNGVLNNELYRGRLIWNKVRMVKALTPAAACRARTLRSSGRPFRSPTSQSSPMKCSKGRNSARQLTPINFRRINGDRATSFPACCGARRAAPACLPTAGRTGKRGSGALLLTKMVRVRIP
jgi:site-specific DNA recombinase